MVIALLLPCSMSFCLLCWVNREYKGNCSSVCRGRECLKATCHLEHSCVGSLLQAMSGCTDSPLPQAQPKELLHEAG